MTDAPSTDTTRSLIHALAHGRLEPSGQSFLEEARSEIGGGVDDARFAALIALASRHARGGRQLGATDEECAEAGRLLAGWTPERWTLLETLRVALVLARPDLAGDSAVAALESVFEFADEGEQRALYRSLAHLPDAARFTWRAGEGCRTNIVPVFEAVACDTPFPSQHLDDVAWNQLCIKAVFIGAPLWRVHGLDGRLSPELARMALDLVEERRSAGRPIQPELWLCLGEHGGQRGLDALRAELVAGDEQQHRAALVGLARAGSPLDEHADGPHADLVRRLQAGEHGQALYRELL